MTDRSYTDRKTAQEAAHFGGSYPPRLDRLVWSERARLDARSRELAARYADRCPPSRGLCRPCVDDEPETYDFPF